MALLVALLSTSIAAQPASPPARFGDFAAYWVAGNAFIQRENSRDPMVVERIADEEGLSQAFVIWNPPWVYPLLVPFALLPFNVGALLWCIMNAFLAAWCAVVLGRRSGLSPTVSIAITFTFTPIAACIGISQLSILVLSGVVAFDEARRKDRPYLAGIALALCAVKPHLVALWWVYVFVSGARAERFRSFVACGVIISLLTLATYWWIPATFRNDWAALQNPPSNAPTNYFSATVPNWLRMAVESYVGRSELVFLQFLPLVIAIPIIVFSMRQTSQEGVQRNGDTFLLFSVLLLPYGWHYDQVLLLPIFLSLWGVALRTTPNNIPLLAALLAIQVVGGVMLAGGASEKNFVAIPVSTALVWIFARLWRFPRHLEDEGFFTPAVRQNAAISTTQITSAHLTLDNG